VDPLTKSYPWYTPYQFAGNNPIKFIDLDGAEQYDPDMGWILDPTKTSKQNATNIQKATESANQNLNRINSFKGQNQTTIMEKQLGYDMDNLSFSKSGDYIKVYNNTDKEVVGSIAVEHGAFSKYTDGSITVQWNNTQNYWEMIGFPTTITGTFISTTVSDIPDTNWTIIGSSVTQQVIVYQGNCPIDGKGGFTTQLFIEQENPTCVGDNNGSIFATPYYPSTWSYSLDGLIYPNYSGIFTNLSEGLYTVYAKDSGGTVITETVTLVADPLTYITIPYTTSLQQISSVGNMNYYNFKVIYNTSLIPVGESVTFDFKFIYSLIYNQPGTVLFDTDNSTILLNGNNQTINNTNSSPFLISGPLPCNPTYYNQLVGSQEYSVSSLTLVNGDTFEANIVYGIDTQSAGANLNGCITQGSVNINASFENVSITCNCCNLTVNQINQTGNPQIYIF
jgi:hypothetical protein